MHGRHFTFKSVLSHTAITIVAPSVTGTLVSREKPYVVQGPWLQVLLPEDLSERMAHEFQILSSPNQVCYIGNDFDELSVMIAGHISYDRYNCQRHFLGPTISWLSRL